MQLTIEYVFEGHKRGYNITSSTRGVDEAHQRKIWRSAMPRGQGWGQYMGATSLKCFPLDEDTVAVSQIRVTDLEDENGRKGIRKAVVDLLSVTAYFAFLRDKLDTYPDDAKRRAEEKFTFCRKTNIIHKTLPRFRRDTQLVMAYPYRNADNWQTIEAFNIRLVLEPIGMMSRWGSVIPFTTLALDYREESSVVTLPATKSTGLDVPVVALSQRI